MANILFALDSINGRLIAQQTFPIVIDTKQEEKITITGWAMDQNAQKTAGGVFINIDGQKDIPVAYGGDRPDVAKYFNKDNYRFSGFSAC